MTATEISVWLRWRWRRAMPFVKILLSPSGVVVAPRGRDCRVEPALPIVVCGWKLLHAIYQATHSRATPTTSRPRALTFGQLAGEFHTMDANIVEHLAPTNMKTQTQFIVDLHGPFTLSFAVISHANQEECPVYHDDAASLSVLRPYHAC